MKNKLTDLNNYLFMQLERLSDESLSADQLESEVKRAKAIQSTAACIIDNARVALDAEQLKAEYGGRVVQFPNMLG